MILALALALSFNPILTVVASYQPQTKHCLALEFGQHVQLVEECSDWYRGRFLTRGASLGIFPKNHVALKQCKVSGPAGQFETVQFEEDQLAREIADVIREWGRLLLIQFEDPEQSDLRFKALKDKLMKLIEYRREILAGTLPHVRPPESILFKLSMVVATRVHRHFSSPSSVSLHGDCIHSRFFCCC